MANPTENTTLTAQNSTSNSATFSAQNVAQTSSSANPVVGTVAKEFSTKKKVLFVFLAFVIIGGSLWLGGQLKLFAITRPYEAGETLDPACAPGDSNCTVKILPSQTSNAGKILSTDGTTTSWINETGGLFDGSQTITRAVAGQNTSVGSATGTLKDFIQAYFFPAVSPVASLSGGGGTVEWGSSTGVTLSYTVTRHTNPVTAITLSGPASSSVSASGTDTATNAYTISIVPGSTINSSGVDGGSQSATRSASTSANTNTTFTLSVTPTASATTSRSYSPKVYYGVSTSNYMDTTAYPDGATLYSNIRSLGGALQGSRAVSTTAFTNASAVYVYFAWPSYNASSGPAFTTYEPSAGCKATTDGSTATSGSVSCFLSGTSAAILNPVGDMLFRDLPNFVNGQSVTIHYVLYRAHFTTTAGGTYYFQVQ